MFWRGAPQGKGKIEENSILELLESVANSSGWEGLDVNRSYT